MNTQERGLVVEAMLDAIFGQHDSVLCAFDEDEEGGCTRSWCGCICHTEKP